MCYVCAVLPSAPPYNALQCCNGSLSHDSEPSMRNGVLPLMFRLLVTHVQTPSHGGFDFFQTSTPAVWPAGVQRGSKILFSGFGGIFDSPFHSEHFEYSQLG